MDVITFLPPENNVTIDRFPPVSRAYPETRSASSASFSAASPASAAFPFAAIADVPAAMAFPTLFLLAACAFLSLVPVFQGTFGFYRLDRMELPADESSEASMREMVAPEPDASLLAESAVAEIPALVKTVSYGTYKVRKGDTMGGILARFGLRNISTIVSANSISNVKRLRVGQTLSVPSMDGLSYTVVRGDSIGRIASRYAVPVNAILDANDLESETLVAGKKLFIPGATLSASELKRAMGDLFVMPLRGRLTSRFGWRSDPFTGVRTFHTGIDLASPIGTPIKATMDGKVATTGYSTVFGNYVILSHSGGYQSLYGHMSSIGVSRGQRVSQGSVIGRVGNTGYSTGSHCHFSIYKNGKMINPYSVLD